MPISENKEIGIFFGASSLDLRPELIDHSDRIQF
jgi:hypothetical protein